MLSKIKIRTGLALMALALVAGCAENPALSYGQAVTAQQCQQMYEAERNAWLADQAAQKTADQQVAAFFNAFSNGLGIYSGEELFQRRRAVCLNRVSKLAASLVPQPGAIGQPRAYACRRGGGVMQGGGAICPGH